MIMKRLQSFLSLILPYSIRHHRNEAQRLERGSAGETESGRKDEAYHGVEREKKDRDEKILRAKSEIATWHTTASIHSIDRGSYDDFLLYTLAQPILAYLTILVLTTSYYRQDQGFSSLELSSIVSARRRKTMSEALNIPACELQATGQLHNVRGDRP